MSGCYRILALLVLSIVPVQWAAAQDWPNRPIRVIASQGAGGLSDVWMRAVADELGGILGATVVVEDRAGAAGTIGARACAESAPDGYTFCIISTEAMVTNPVINPVAGFEPMKALTPVTKAFYLQQVFAVTDQIKVKSFDQLAAYAKANPKTVNYMSASLTKTAFVEEFKRKHGIDLVRVPFKGGGDAINSMMTNTTQIAIFGIGNLIQLIRDGKIARACGRRRQALAARARHPDLQGNRLHPPPRGDLLRHLRAGRNAAADDRQGPGRRRQGRLQPGVPEAPHEFAGADRGAQHAGRVRQAARAGARRGA